MIVVGKQKSEQQMEFDERIKSTRTQKLQNTVNRLNTLGFLLKTSRSSHLETLHEQSHHHVHMPPFRCCTTMSSIELHASVSPLHQWLSAAKQLRHSPLHYILYNCFISALHSSHLLGNHHCVLHFRPCRWFIQSSSTRRLVSSSQKPSGFNKLLQPRRSFIHSISWASFVKSSYLKHLQLPCIFSAQHFAAVSLPHRDLKTWWRLHRHLGCTALLGCLAIFSSL